jgi:hypothetical protein
MRLFVSAHSVDEGVLVPHACRQVYSIRQHTSAYVSVCSSAPTVSMKTYLSRMPADRCSRSLRALREPDESLNTG